VSGPAEELGPVREALLAAARADATATAEQAEAAAAAVLDEARARADAIVAAARAEGERDAARTQAREAARVHREGRETVLRAQQEAYARLRIRARAEVRALRADPAYAGLLERLRSRARAELGEDAEIREHPDGGVVAETPGRWLDLSLPALADQAVDALGAEVTRLWAPDA
jgi:hypothetical protein